MYNDALALACSRAGARARTRDEAAGEGERGEKKRKGRAQRREKDLMSFAPRGEARRDEGRKGGRARLTMKEKRKREKTMRRGRKKRKKPEKKKKKKKNKTTTTKEEGEASSVGTSPSERTTHVDEWLSTRGYPLRIAARKHRQIYDFRRDYFSFTFICHDLYFFIFIPSRMK